MSVAYYYDKDFEYVTRRLNGTVLFRMEDKVPVCILNVVEDLDKSSGSYKANILEIPTGKQYQAPLATLDMEPPRVGFVNLPDRAVYVFRRPVRKYRQGLHSEQLTTSKGGSMRDLPPLYDAVWVPTYTNTYPSFKEACVKINKDRVRSAAFARDFAVGYESKVIILYYQDTAVGRVQAGVPVLDAKYHFLTEKLQQDLRG